MLTELVEAAHLGSCPCCGVSSWWAWEELSQREQMQQRNAGLSWCWSPLPPSADLPAWVSLRKSETDSLSFKWYWQNDRSTTRSHETNLILAFYPQYFFMLSFIFCQRKSENMTSLKSDKRNDSYLVCGQHFLKNIFVYKNILKILLCSREPTFLCREKVYHKILCQHCKLS